MTVRVWMVDGETSIGGKSSLRRSCWSDYLPELMSLEKFSIGGEEIWCCLESVGYYVMELMWSE